MNADLVLEQIRFRARERKLVDATTGYVDDRTLEGYFFNTLQFLVTRYQLQNFLDIRRELLRTSPNVETYAMIPHFGFIAPHETRRSGLSLTTTDSSNPVDLQYYDPIKFNLYQNTSTSPSRPAFWTLAHDLIWLSPIPDDIYIIQAILRADPTENGTVPETYIQAVQADTLYRWCADRGQLTQDLIDERNDLLKIMVNNEERVHQHFTRETRYRRYGRTYKYPR